MIGSRPRLALACSILAVLGGCGFSAGPTLRVVGAQTAQSTPDGRVIEFELVATNPTSNPLPLRGSTYTLNAAQGGSSGVSRSPEVTVPPNAQISFILPVAIPPGDSTLAYVLEGNVRYVAPGPFAQALYDNGLSRPTVAFRDEGVIEP